LIFGRIRVQYRRENGTFVRPDIKSKKQLLKKLAQMIPEIQQSCDPQMKSMADQSMSILPPEFLQSILDKPVTEKKKKNK
jgi:hypothetical protein